MTGGENRERERFVRVKWSDSRQRKRERIGFCGSMESSLLILHLIDWLMVQISQTNYFFLHLIFG